jgi:DNA replication protein DnaC
MNYPSNTLYETTCAMCGTQLVVPYWQPDQSDEYYDAIMNTFNAFKNCVVCDECDDKLKAADEKKRIRHAGKMAVELGLVNESTLSCTFETSKPDCEGQNAKQWAEARRMVNNRFRQYRSLYVSGPTGVGKSHLCRCILNACLPRRIAETTFRELVKRSLSYDPAAASWLKDIKNVYALLLDDIDKFDPTEQAMGLLWEVLDKRCSMRGITLITSNINMRDTVVKDVRGNSVTVDGLYTMLKRRHPQNTTLITATFERLNPCLTLEMTGRSLRKRNDI